MPDGTMPTAPLPERSLAEQALANLVDQFARPLDFLRELVQNSIDAGSPRIDVWVDHQPGLLSIGVEDHGSGMDESTIDGQLLSLYASTKEDDRTKLGKFGIGFTSVFALRPDRVLVRTGRHGTWWELVAGPDRVFHKHRSSEPISGTQVILFKRLADERIGPLIEEIRQVLGYWCEHSLVPITFEDRRHDGTADDTDPADPFADVTEGQQLEQVQRPMALDDAWLQRRTVVDMGPLGPVEVVAGYADSPAWGFYNGGLTLLRTRDDEVLGDYAARLRHVSFKVRSDRLEHTLTRDNVRRDEAWRRTLDAVARVHLQLRQDLLDHLADAGRPPTSLGRAHGQLAAELAVDPSFAPAIAAARVLLDAAGQPCTPNEALVSGEAFVAPLGHPLAPALQAEGQPVVLDAPPTRDLLQRLLDILKPAQFALPAMGTPRRARVHPVDRAWVQAHPIEPTTLPELEQLLLERTQALVAVASTPAVSMPLIGPFAMFPTRPNQVRLCPARVARAGGAPPEADPICVEGPDDGSVFRRPTAATWSIPWPLRSRSLLVDVAHPTYVLHRTSAHHDLELAALGLAHAILHSLGHDRDAAPTGGTMRLLERREAGGAMTEEDPLEAALARARSPSTFVESRPFTLSRERAVEKQREFALRDPAQVVLELVQGAVFAGASAIAVETHPDRLMVAWVGGRTFTEGELEGWVDHLFADRTDPTMRPMVQLATGLNALLQRRPLRLSVETGDGSHAFRLDLDTDGNGRIGTVPEGIEATFVVASFPHNLWHRLTRSGVTDELHLVEERCLYTPVPIYLNGRAPFGYRPTRHIEVFGADQQAHFDDGVRRGVVATHLHPRAATGFRTVVGGVWITTLPMPELRAKQLLGVVCDDALRKTADHADIVQDRRYVELLHALQPYATRVLQGRDPDYRPPPLPPVPDAPARQVGADRVEPRPLPEMIPSVVGRRPVPLDRLDGHPGPLFVVAPDDRERLRDRVAIDAFPFTVLVLDEGQLLTLAQRLPEVPLHRLTSTADVEFVRRALDRERRIQEVRTADEGDQVRLVQHRGGVLPDAGTGAIGWPYLVRGPGGLVDAGVLVHGQAISSHPDQPATRPFQVGVPLDGVVLQVERTDDGPLEASHLAAAADMAWRLAATEGPDGALELRDPALLARILGAVALPVPRADGLAVSLPGGWPAGLVDLPLARVDGLDVSASSLANDVAHGRVRWVDVDILQRVGPLARRLGAGHLAAEPLDRGVLGVGRVGDSWVWLEGPSMWSLTAVTTIVGVHGHLGEPSVPEGWRALSTAGPPLIAWHRADVPAPDLQEGWRLLLQRLERLLDEVEGWGLHVRAQVPPAHLEHVARLARARLTRAPVSASSFDEVQILRARGREASLAPPERSVDGAYVLQRRVTLGDVEGVLGLVHPFRPDAQVVVRTLHDRAALPIPAHAPPVHGRLWSREPPAPDLPDRVRLAALGLDEELLHLLKAPLPDERQASVEAYAIDRVLRASTHGPPQGLAAELARRVELRDAENLPWGSLHQWFTTPPDRRPPLPVPAPPAPPSDHAIDVEARLRSALRGLAPRLELRIVDSGRSLARVDAGRSHAGQLVLAVQGAHPIAAAGLAGPGRAREVLLLELVRLGCAWGRLRGAPLPLGVAQTRLVAQRLR